MHSIARQKYTVGRKKRSTNIMRLTYTLQSRICLYTVSHKILSILFFYDNFGKRRQVLMIIPLLLHFVYICLKDKVLVLDGQLVSTNNIFTVATRCFVAVVVVVVMVTRCWSGVYHLPESCDVSVTSTTLGNTLLRYAHLPWNRLAGQTLNNSCDSQW